MSKVVDKNFIKKCLVAVLIATVHGAMAEATNSWQFDYTGAIQSFTAPKAGIYELKVWGAQGGRFGTESSGGLGGYATCHTTLAQGETIYIYVGGQGGTGLSSGGGAGGWNGGGAGGNGYGGFSGSGGGGGATHISKVNNQVIGSGSGQCASLAGSNYIIVAGGGGGASHPWTTPGSGGGTEGGLGTRCNGTSDSQFAYSANFYYNVGQSYGANGGNSVQAASWDAEGAGGGGGGYYGGTSYMPNGNFPAENCQDAGGCGGNSACNSAFATAFSTTAGQREGNGKAEIVLLIQGTGTTSDPCLIGTAQELKNFAAVVNGGNTTANGKLIAPIDLAGSETNQWTPIGAGTWYNGTFDGQGFTVSNLYYHQAVASPGLFGHAGGSARIKNVRVVVDIDNTGNGATVASGSTEAGGILGTGSGAVIINCSVAGSVFSFSNVGGIAGSGTVTIVNCYNEATVKFCSSVGQTGGGIYGYGGANIPTLVNCYNVGKIINTGSETSHIGNIATQVNSASNCYSLENSCKNGKDAEWSNGTIITGTTKTLAEMKSTSFVSTLNDNVATQRSTYPDIEDWILHPTTSLPVHKNSVKYTITCDLNGGIASNAAYYDMTMATFTLNNPTRAGYLFMGWTGSNGSTPQTTVTIAQGSTGNRAYTANWISWDEVNAYVGKVIGADGKMYKTVAAAQNAGTTASGVIAYWGSAGSVESGTNYRGMAISLDDIEDPSATEPSEPRRFVYCWNHADCNGGGYGFLDALNLNNGIAATTLGFNNSYSHSYGHHATVYSRYFDQARPAGASEWSLPSLGQWNMIAKALTGSTTNLSTTSNNTFSYQNIRSKIVAAGGSGFNWAMYWSTTECAGFDNADKYTWVVNFSDGSGFVTAEIKDNSINHWNIFVRPFFAFEDATDAIYTISYDANGGSGAPSAQTKDGGIDLNLSGVAPTCAGYVFKGWNTAADGSGANYAGGATFAGNADTTLYAQWGGYGAWADANGIAGAWDEKDASGIYNVFRYVFNMPTGFADIAGCDVEGDKIVITTPAVANLDGVTVNVVESSDSDGASQTNIQTLNSTGRAEFSNAFEGVRYYHLKASMDE